MKRKFLFTVLLAILAKASFAQQDKTVTHFIYDKMSLNPGSTGINEGICVTSIYRNQWDKVNGAPNSVIFNGEANLNRYFPGGVGISFYHDAIGFARQNNVLLNYSYPLTIPVGTLGIGVGIGITNFGMDPTWAPPTSTPDPTLPSAWSATGLDMNLGVYLKGNDNYYAGISVTHLSATDLVDKASANSTSSSDYATARHFYLMGGKKFPSIGPGDIDANLLMRTDLLRFQADINARYIWQNMAYGGLTIRTSDAIALMFGAQPFKIVNKNTSPLDHFVVGYSYDISIHKLSDVSLGTHEILVKYCHYLPPVPLEKSKHPRWL